MKKIPYGRQNIDQNDIDAVVSSLQSDNLTQGPKVKDFEIKFAEYIYIWRHKAKPIHEIRSDRF